MRIIQRFLLKVPLYQAHYVLFLDAIELATDARKNNSQTLQCIKCKHHLVGRTKENTLAMLKYHYENDECLERSIRYTVPTDRETKYKHHIPPIVKTS